MFFISFWLAFPFCLGSRSIYYLGIFECIVLLPDTDSYLVLQEQSARGQYDTRPRFFIVGGLVFQPLSILAKGSSIILSRYTLGGQKCGRLAFHNAVAPLESLETRLEMQCGSDPWHVIRHISCTTWPHEPFPIAAFPIAPSCSITVIGLFMELLFPSQLVGIRDDCWP